VKAFSVSAARSLDENGGRVNQDVSRLLLMRAKAAPRAPADLAQAVPLKAPHMIPGGVPWTAFGTVAGTFRRTAQRGRAYEANQ